MVLYVGKASVLPNRVASYFQPSADHGHRKNTMLPLVEDFDVIECEGEWEALLLESRLVKDIRPRFNERLVDDKTFPYLVVTTRDEFPGVFTTRNPADERFKGAKVFGPFTSVQSLRQAVQLLQRVFKYRTCDLDIRSDDPRNRSFRPCLLHSIGQCTAPCANRVSPENYRADIDRFLRFLGSKRSQMLRELKTEMDQAAEARRFERAAVIRDQIRAIERLDERERRRKEDGQFDWQPEVTSFVHDPLKGVQSLQRTLGLDEPIRCMEAIDIAHLAGEETVGQGVLHRRPSVQGLLPAMRIRSLTATTTSIREVVSRRRGGRPGARRHPDRQGLGQLHAAAEAFEELEADNMVISLAKKEELIHVQRRASPFVSVARTSV